MPGILKTKVSTYEFSLDSMRDLIAKDLEVEPEKIEVQYVIQSVGGSYQDERGTPAVTKIRVNVKH